MDVGLGRVGNQGAERQRPVDRVPALLIEARNSPYPADDNAGTSWKLLSRSLILRLPLSATATDPIPTAAAHMATPATLILQ
jgi:hypothetical protein